MSRDPFRNPADSIGRLEATAARARALAAVRRATIQRERAERAWRLAQLDAAEQGCSLRDVGEMAGVSHVRVLQVVRELEEELS